MDWEKTLDFYGALIEERLKGYFAETVKEARGYHSFVAKVYSDLEELAISLTHWRCAP